eukprot:c832_g1_i1 orf=40-288(-)
MSTIHDSTAKSWVLQGGNNEHCAGSSWAEESHGATAMRLFPAHQEPVQRIHDLGRGGTLPIKNLINASTTQEGRNWRATLLR